MQDEKIGFQDAAALATRHGGPHIPAMILNDKREQATSVF
jgi:hypothetical protein